MEIVFVRHGEPTYEHVGERGYRGHGRDLSQLTPRGREQARRAADDPRLRQVECIVSSPYTRALQTAAILSRHLDTDLEVELDLHEWLPDLTFAYDSGDFAERASQLCIRNKGVCPPDSPIRYEELRSVFCRVKGALDKYRHCKKIAVVAHGFVILQFAGWMPPHCGLAVVELTPDFQWCNPAETQNV